LPNQWNLAGVKGKFVGKAKIADIAQAFQRRRTIGTGLATDSGAGGEGYDQAVLGAVHERFVLSVQLVGTGFAGCLDVVSDDEGEIVVIDFGNSVA